MFYVYEEPAAAEVAKALDDQDPPALRMLAAELAYAPWERKSLAAAISAVLKATGLKMPALAMPARLLITAARRRVAWTR